MSKPIPIPAWQRPYWQASDEEIVLQFYVFGKFEAEQIPSADYGSAGLPPGVELTSHQHAALRHWEGYPLKGGLGRMLKEEAPEAYQQAVDAPQVLVLRGKLKDSADTGYLRDVLGVLAGLLDIGGVAILDPQILSLFGAADWRKHYLLPEGAPIRHHVLILCDGDEAAGRFWIHTRGLRKFGRPDISIRNVPAHERERAGALCQQLVDLQALGTRFGDGQAFEVDGVPGGLVAQLGGGMDDPRFNNTYVGLRWAD
jgi:hypothetical protein